MVQIAELSRVGLGTYRMHSGNDEHLAAGCLAVENGCNLIDTAPLYQNGDSEKLVALIEKNCKNKKLFVISKFGYASQEDLSNATESGKKDFFKISDRFHYSLESDFIENQLNNSLSRLNRDFLDCYLIHNPEYFLKLKIGSKQDFYNKLQQVFYFLESLVEAGKIRYYGVSSNNLSLHPDADHSIDLRTVIDTVNKVSKNHHFSFIQFPFNAIEKQASLPLFNNLSLIDIARQNNLVILSNRPLNAYEANEQHVRLATGISWRAGDKIVSVNIIDDFSATVNRRLSHLGINDRTSDFPFFSLLAGNDFNPDNFRSLDKLFSEHVLPFLEFIYDGDIDKSNPNLTAGELSLFNNFYLFFKRIVISHMNNKTNNTIKKLIEEKIITNDRGLAAQFIAGYLASGIDHVLLGMTNVAYVKEVKQLFI